MGILNRLFGTEESISKHALKDEETISKDWNEYRKTIQEKQQIISQLSNSFGKVRQVVSRLKQLIDSEIVDINDENIEEKDLIKNIRKLEHSQRINRLHQLEKSLCYMESRHKYVYELLRHLYAVLKSENDIVLKIEKNNDLRKFRSYCEEISKEFAIEIEIIQKIDERETFTEMLSEIVRGQHIIHKLDKKEKRMFSTMKKRMSAIASDKITDGITCQWAVTVYNSVLGKVDELCSQGLIDKHYDAELEFVNRPAFVDLAREVIQNIRGREVSPQMLNVFVETFREWYNHERG
jgi:acyl carrier protein phosphodiesterase